MAAKRELEIAGTHLVLSEHNDLLDPASAKSLPGTWLWDCSLVLAHWLDSWPPSSFQNARVVELGAGTGLPGMVASLLGAHVVLTDRPSLLPGLQRNVDDNGLQNSITVHALEWGDDCSALSPPFDFILMSDVLYDVAAMPHLCKTLVDLSNARTQILLAYELRPGTTECFKVLRDRGFWWQKVANEELHPRWQSEDIGVFKVWRDS